MYDDCSGKGGAIALSVRKYPFLPTLPLAAILRKDRTTLRTQAEQPSETIKMVDNALNVLDLLRVTKGSLGVNEIAKQCQLTASTTCRILKTLEMAGWAFQTNDDRYIVGGKISFVTEKDNLYLALREVALYVMKEYTAKYNQAMNLLVRDGAYCTILQQSRTNKLMDYTPPLRTTLPFYACAGGKILLSELPVSLMEQIINSCEMVPLTPCTITDPAVFRQAIREAERNGYAFDHSESVMNGTCIAVPIRNYSGTIIATLSFSGFIGVEDTSTLLPYLEPLREASERITSRLYATWKH